MITPNISWEENSVLITYQDSQISYNYSLLPDTDVVITGLDLDDFNAMLESIRYDPKRFVKNFKNRNVDPPGYQRCRALNIARIYPNHFNIVSQSFCTLAYRYPTGVMPSAAKRPSSLSESTWFLGQPSVSR
jgi:hypothetical protein